MNKHEIKSMALMRETHYYMYYQSEEIEKKLILFSQKVTDILKKKHKEISSEELRNLKDNLEIAQITETVIQTANQIKDNYNLNLPDDIKRYQVRILVLAEENIIELIENYSPKIAEFIRKDLNSNILSEKSK